MLNFIITKLKKELLLTAVIIIFITVTVSAHDVKGAVPERPLAPVTYYQWFMITLAVAYTLYLAVRAQKRKLKSKSGDDETGINSTGM